MILKRYDFRDVGPDIFGGKYHGFHGAMALDTEFLLRENDVPTGGHRSTNVDLNISLNQNMFIENIGVGEIELLSFQGFDQDLDSFEKSLGTIPRKFEDFFFLFNDQ